MSSLTPSRYYARVFGLATAAVLAYLLFRILFPFAVPLMWASLLAFMLQPANDKLLLRWPKKPGLASGILTAVVGVVVTGPLSLFVFAFLRQASDLLNRFQAEAAERKLPALQLVLELKPVQMLLDKAGDFTSLSKAQILSSAAEAAQGALQQAASLGGTVVVGAVNVITQFGLTLFLLFFFLRDGKAMLLRGIRLIPMTRSRKDDLAATLGGVTRAVVLGTLVTSLVQGTLVGIGFAIAGLPSPLVFGAVGAVASLIPVVGTSLVWGPAAITLIAQGQTGWAIFLVAWSVVLVAGSDNVIRPMIISGSSKASTLLVFVGLLGGIGVFGFAGIFMGPLVLTLVATLLRYADQELPRLAGASSGGSGVTPYPFLDSREQISLMGERSVSSSSGITEPPGVPSSSGSSPGVEAPKEAKQTSESSEPKKPETKIDR
ncbi:MAG: AI-2E family transporter [Myxococcaceae bacterium]